jgi:glyoxylase-like metal-dependent hydrolase (beta-lactamase superfamily II)
MTGAVEQVADGVWRARGTDVNWFLLRSGDEVTLVDCGYPGDTRAVLASIRSIGSRPEDVRAVLLTHAHVDHMGAANHLHEAYGTPTWTDPVEVAHAHRDRLEQAGPADVVRNLWRPGVLPWTLRISRAGATRPVSVPHALPFPSDGPLDLPGHPVPVATHGHTSGHTAFHLPGAGAVITGDGLVTGHAVSRRTGPQLIMEMFNHGDARAGLAPLEGLDADLVLPGHGEPWRGPIAEAVAQARATA